MAGRVWFILHSVRTEERSVTMLAIGVSGLHQNRREEVLHLPLSLNLSTSETIGFTYGSSERAEC